jgi:predicted alpha/beta-hydrolase family hydrolase
VTADYGMKRFEKEKVQGWLHEPSGAPRAAIVLTHGAGSDCDAPFLVAAAKSLAEAGYAVLRYDLPFRQAKTNALNAAQQARDREGIRRAAEELRKLFPRKPLVLAGHSYGGRQSSMLAAEDRSTGDGLMLLSYPLHPPRMPEKLRTDHFKEIRVPALFVHGTRDPFGTVQEMEVAVSLISAPTRLVPVEKGAHNLPPSAAALLPEWLSAIMNI